MKTNDEKKLPDLGFEVGDNVDFMGAIGTVSRISASYVFVGFKLIGTPNEAALYFLPDGRMKSWDTIPSLKLIEKKKKPRKVITLYRYTFVRDIHTYQTSWSSNENFRPNGVVVKVETKEVEIDEL